MAFLDTYRHQVALLIRTLPFVAAEPEFALKGGTAINLFVRNMPRLSVDIDEPIQLDSFPGAIEQVVTSFIDNALIHAFAATDTGSMVLRATIHEGLVALEFSDNGNGMDEHTAKHAFDPFFSTRMGIGGSGLGLYIVNNIVTSVLGGTIELVTSPGNGTRFQLRLPQVAPEPEMEQNRSV